MHTPIYQQLQGRCLLNDPIQEVNGTLCDIKVSPCTDLMILHSLPVHIKLSQMCMCKCHWWHFKHRKTGERFWLVSFEHSTLNSFSLRIYLMVCKICIRQSLIELER